MVTGNGKNLIVAGNFLKLLKKILPHRLARQDHVQREDHGAKRQLWGQRYKTLFCCNNDVANSANFTFLDTLKSKHLHTAISRLRHVASHQKFHLELQ